MLVKGYSDLSVKTPDCHPGVPAWVARFRFDADVTELFPYINAVIEEAEYHETPHHIIFTLDGIRCALYSDNAAASPFIGREEALTFIKRLIDFLNEIDLKRESIEPDYNKKEYIPVLEIFRSLPRTNCRECGYPSCMAFAAALSKRETDKEKCPQYETQELQGKI